MIFYDYNYDPILDFHKEKDPVEEEKLKELYLELKELSKKYNLNIVTPKAPT